MRRTGTVAVAAVGLVVAAGALVSRTDSVRDRVAPTTATGAAGSGEIADAKVAAPSAPGSVGPGGTGGMPAPGSIGPGGSSSVIAPTGPRIVRTAELSVRVGKDGFAGAFERVSAIAAANGGYVTASSTSTTGGKGRARAGQLTLRAPVDKFDDVRRAVGQLGTIESETSQGDDVSGQLVDYDARLRSLQAQEDALRTLLGKAANVGEVLQVQNSLFNVRQQVEQLQAQRTQLDQAASLATLQVSVYEPGALLVVDPEPLPAKGLAHSFERAVDGAVEVVGGMIVVLGWLTPIAVLGGLVWGGTRARRRATGRAATVAP